MPEVLRLRPADPRDATATTQQVPPATADTRKTRAARGETLAFAAAMAAASAWVLDDAFWHREPGTAAADHLVSGLVPVALAVSAVAYPRLRAGARAMLALVAGMLMVVAGVADGALHVAVDRLTGDDLMALLAGAAGIVLVVLGAVTLWRSRRLDERPARRYARRALVALLAAVAGFFVVLPAAFAIVGNEKARSPVQQIDLGRPHVAVALTTSDGLRLSGSYVPARNGAAVIAFPGRTGPVEHARMLVRHGYGVLLLDRRGEGANEGDYNARGWGGEPDLRAAAEQKHMPDAPPEPLRWVAPITVETAAGAVLPDHRPPTDLADLMPRIAPHPVLLVRGMAGGADEALNRGYRDRGGATTTLWEIPRAGHTDGIHAAPAEYERRVVAFFDHALAGAAKTSGR